MTEPPRPPSIAVLISGGGTTLKNLIERHRQGTLKTEIAAVISTSRVTPGLEFANEAAIPAVVIDPSRFAAAEFSRRVFSAVDEFGARWAVLGGFLRRLEISDAWSGRVINIHPSLIPAFAGRGFYGSKVHHAVLDYGCKVSGCSVHFVDNEYDHGPIIAQHPVPVLPGDTVESLSARVFAAECRLYPAVINALADGQISVRGRIVSLDGILELD